MKRIGWIAQLVAAAILAQTLFFKFTYAPETQWIFGEKLGVGRAGATAAGLAELVCAVLLLFPRTAVFGALASLATMGGAIASHLAILGIEVIDPVTGEGDGGLLFLLALTVSAMALIVIAVRRDELTTLIRRVRSRAT